MENGLREAKSQVKEEKRGDVQLEVGAAREYRYCHYTIQSHQSQFSRVLLYFHYSTTEVNHHQHQDCKYVRCMMTGKFHGSYENIRY